MRSSLTELFLFFCLLLFSLKRSNHLNHLNNGDYNRHYLSEHSIFCKISKDLTLSNVMCPERQIIIIRNNRTSESHTEEVTYQYALAV